MIKSLPANVGDSAYDPGSGRLSGEGHGNPLQHYCLENPAEEPGLGGRGLESMGLQRVRYDLVTKQRSHLSSYLGDMVALVGVPLMHHLLHDHPKQHTVTA